MKFNIFFTTLLGIYRKIRKKELVLLRYKILTAYKIQSIFNKMNKVIS